MTSANISRFYADQKAPICPLVIKEHFDTLTDKEKLYAHHIGYASWLGARIILEQTTPQSSEIFDLVRSTFSAKDDATRLADLTALRTAAGVSEEDFTGVLEYAAQFLSNLANYKSFGDIKFIPRVSEKVFRAVVAAAPRADDALPLFDKHVEEIYATTPAARTLLGYLDAGHVTNYYSGDVTQDDIKAVQKWVEGRGQDPLNTRLFKTKGGVLEVRMASAEITKQHEEFKIDDSRTVRVVYGDYAKELAAIADSLAAAIPHAANDHQRSMLEHYVAHFRGGDVNEHKDSQREWIKDIGPSVESNIGFIET
jgi:dipeptidyl-peptidase-3